MTIEEFKLAYANVPLESRLVPINFAASGLMTLQEIYNHIDNLEDYKRTITSQQSHLISLAGPILNQ